MTVYAHRAGPFRQAGLTWFEFWVVAAVLAVLTGSLFTALLYYEELGEATVVQVTVRNIRSGMRFQIADKLTQGRAWDLVSMVEANPLAWVASSPDGYVGEVRNADIGLLPGGSWFFDTDRAELGYIPKLTFHLWVPIGQPTLLRWKVRAIRSDVPWEVEGLRLDSVSPYRWF